jgi:hypothetical protein
MPVPRVKTLTQTCLVAPSQWEGHLTDGRMFYVRCRHGRLEVRVSPVPTTDVSDAVRGGVVLERDLADPRESYMEESVMMEMTATVLDFDGIR